MWQRGFVDQDGVAGAKIIHLSFPLMNYHSSPKKPCHKFPFPLSRQYKNLMEFGFCEVSNWRSLFGLLAIGWRDFYSAEFCLERTAKIRKKIGKRKTQTIVMMTALFVFLFPKWINYLFCSFPPICSTKVAQKSVVKIILKVQI